jgi:hypothetical protein
MRRFLPLLALLFAPLTQAQVLSLYGTFSDPHLTNLVDGATGNNATLTTISHFTPGFGLGATFGFLPIGPIHLGLDVRGSSKPGNDGSDLILVGPRLAAKLPGLRLKPYLQASAGYLRTRTTLVSSPLPAGTQETSTYAAYEIIGGLDYPLLPILDFRVIELGGGQGVSAFDSGDGHNTSLFTVNSGLVLHF